MSNVHSIERALKLLEALPEYTDGIQITRLSDKVGLSKSTVHRFLATLINIHYVIKNQESVKYKLGYSLLFLSRNIMKNIVIISITKPLLEDLVEKVKETIHLRINDMGEVLLVDKIESSQTSRMFYKIRNRASMYCTGVGKVLLSSTNQEQFDKLADNTNFIVKTPSTITSKEQLSIELELIRNQGFGLDNVKHKEGISCIAAPIFDSEGKVIVSFSIAGPSNRITIERIKKTY